MKKQMFLTVLTVVFTTVLLSSCSNSDSNSSKLREPSSEMKENETADQKEAGTVGQADTKAMTIENLKDAFKGETTASAKYAAYSKKAEEEGFHNIALLFKAASMSENVHANNHKSVLEEHGVTNLKITPEFTVKSTKENLEDAIKGESYEVTTMYPEYIKEAKVSGNQLALISFNYAFETEKKHKVMYENALKSLNTNSVSSLPNVYYVCPTCGNTYDTAPPKRCGISMTSSEKFSKIASL